MDFEKEYRIEQDGIKHNIGLDRMILEKCEEKAPKKKISLRKISEFRQQLRMVKIFTTHTAL